MVELQPWQWALAGGAAMLIGLSKTGIAGVGILAVAIFANLLPSKQSTGIILPMLICADIVAVAAYRRHAVWVQLGRLFPWVAIGVVLGFFAVGHVNDRQVRRLIGVVVIVMVILHVWRRQQNLEILPHALWFSVLTGLVAGFTTMVANAAGPVMTIYLLSIGLPKMEFLGTGAWYFLIINLFKVPFSASLGLITPASLEFDAVLAPVVIAGALGGKKLIPHINQKWFEGMALSLTLIAGAWLLR